MADAPPLVGQHGVVGDRLSCRCQWRSLGGVSEQRSDQPTKATWAPASSLDELAHAQGSTGVVQDPADELAADIWDSDEELHAFLVDLRQSRNHSPA